MPNGALPVEAASLLLERPGVLVRRLHQVHSALFQEECAAFGVTPVQYSLLSLVEVAPGLDQGAAAAGLRLDRFTTADVIRRLVAAELLRVTAGADRRTRPLALAPRLPRVGQGSGAWEGRGQGGGPHGGAGVPPGPGPAPAPAQSPVAVPVEAVSEAQIQAFLGGLDYG